MIIITVIIITITTIILINIIIINFKDYIFLMNRSRAGWKTWYTDPLPNIGMFLCRGKFE